MKGNQRLGLGLLAGTVALLVAVPVRAACSFSGPSAPSPETRTYHHAQLGFSFEIPANYRAMATSVGTVQFHDPATFAYIQCLVKHNSLAARPAGTELAVRTVLPHEPSLIELIQRTQPWLSFYNPTFEPLLLSGQEAFLYRYTRELDGANQAALSVLLPDPRALVSLEGSPDSAVLTLAASTFQF